MLRLFALAMAPLSFSVFAQTPPCQLGMVVRSGAMNYDAKILEFNSASGLYKVEYIKRGNRMGSSVGVEDM